MSKTIDQKVVEMQFDNRQFERNVSTTLSSVEKLKQKLDFNGSVKGLDNISASVKKVDMNGLGSAVETVRARFSALEVMGVTALANITNSAVNTGKQMIKALTIDPVLTGFQEYETQINAVQTILANTQSKGSTLEDVNAALDELNKYADQTIYNFTEMTRNIGTFTAAGVDLDKSVTSIKGIANLAAVSGSNAQQASTAMYQLSQALAAGKVQLMDWNSVVNAGMGGEVFQTALKRTATQMGYNVDALIEKYGSFRESLTKGGWLTAEVLTETLTQLSGAYTEADLLAQGYSEKQAKEIVELANTAVSAATDVKTFTQLVDTLKEAVQSGWTQTWEIILGDFEEAKALFTEASDIFGGIIQSSADARNNLLEGALGGSSKWDELTQKINEAGISTEVFNKELEKTAREQVSNLDEIIAKHGSLANAFRAGAISTDVIVKTLKNMVGISTKASGTTADMTNKLEYFNDVVGKVIRGDFGNGEARIQALTKAGYDNVAVQTLVNKIWERNGKNWSNCTVTAEELSEVISSLSKEELQSIGYTKEQAEKLKELAEQAEKTGTPINKLLEDLNRPTGRELLIDTFRNSLTGLISVCKAVGEAWRDAFPPMTSDQLYNAIAAVHSFSEGLVPTEETLKNLTRTLKGLFAILDIITTITGGAFKFAFKTLSTILGMADLSILEFTAVLGDAAVGLRDFLLDNELVNAGFDFLASGIVASAKAIASWIDAFRNLPMVQTAVDNLKNGLLDLKEIGTWAIEGLQNGLKDGIQSVPAILVKIGRAILDAIKGALGIHSPSTEMYAVGKYSIQGLIEGFSDGLASLVAVIQNIASISLNILKNAPWGSFIAAGISIGLIKVTSDLVKIVSAFAAPFEGLGDLLSGAGEVLSKSAKSISKVIKSFANVMNSYALSIKANALKSIAIAIGILAASVFLLAQLDTGKLWSSIGALAALAVVLGTLTLAIGKFGPDKALSFSGFALAVVGISASLLIMASAMKKLSSIDPERSAQTIAAFVGIVASMAAILAVYGTLVKGQSAASIAKVGTMMLALSTSLLLMVAVIKLISGLSAAELLKGGAAITAFVGIVGMLAVVSRFAGAGVGNLGGTMIKLSIALGLMVGVIKLISGLSAAELIKGGAAITAFVGIIGGLTLITNFGTANSAKLGTTLLAMSTSMLIMVGVVKLISGMSVADIVKGQAAILAFTGIIALLISAVKLAGPEAPKLATTLLAMSLSIGILAAIAVALAFIDVEGMAKGITVVGILSAFMAGLIAVTKFANDVKGSLITLTVAVAVLTGAVVALSFVDPTRLAGATAALSILLGMFALLIKSTSNVTGSMGTLIAMSAAIAVLGGVVFALAQLPIESTLGVVLSLSTLLLALSASMKILSTVKTVSPSAIAALAALSLIAGGLAVLLNMIEPLDAGSTIETVISLSTLLTALSGVTAILALVGKLGAGAALQGVLALSGVILVIGGLMAGIGALVTYFPQMEEFVNNGIDLLNGVAYGIGSFVGNIIGGLMDGVTSGLPGVATNLSEFMANLQPFLDGVKMVDSSVIESARALAEMILIFTATDVLNGLTSWLTGGSSLTEFADQLVPFGEAMVQFSDAVSGKIDAASVEAASNAGLTLAKLASTLPKEGGLLQGFLGTADLESFGKNIAAFGSAIVAFSSEVDGKINAASVEAAANAGMTLANLANNIPKQDGLLQDFLGNQDLGVFGSQLRAFGKAIADFSKEVAGNVNPEAVTAAADAGMILANLASNIPKQDGILQDFLGEQDLGRFGDQLKKFGGAMAAFSESLSGGIDAEVVTAASNAGMALANLANNLPKQDGILQDFFGDQDMGTFGEQLAVFGQKFAEYANYVKDIDPSVVTATSNAADSLVKLADSLPESGLFSSDTTLDEFGAQLSSFGAYFASYYNSISGINVYTLSNVIDEVWRILSLAKGMEGFDSASMRSFGSSLSKLGNTGIYGFIQAFTNSGPKIQGAVNSMLNNFVSGVNSNKSAINSAFLNTITEVTTGLEGKYNDFTQIGKTYMDMIFDGVQSKKAILNNSVTAIVNTLLTTIRGKYGEFKNAGSYVVSGFAEGINQNSSATRAARKLAQNTITAMQKELKIASPSKVARDEVGNYVVEGIAEGITEDMSAEDAASKKAQNITSAFQEEFDLLDLAEETAQLEAQLNGTTEDYLAKHERQVKRVELAYGQYQVTLQNFGETATETQEAYNKYLQQEIDLRALATEEAEAASEKTREQYEAQVEWVNKLTEERNAGLIEELALWKNLQSAYVDGSEERIEIDEKILSLQEELKDATEEYYDSLTEAQEEANQKRLEIDQSYEDERTQIKEDAANQRLQIDQEYADKTAEVNDQLKADIEELEKAYEDAVSSRADSLYNAYGLFDAVQKDEEAVSGDTLIENLEGQLNAFQEWTDNINSLVGKGLDEALIEELRDMGPSSAAEIAALNAMSEEQLNKYVELWRSKHELAKNQAIFELDSMRQDTDEQIEQLKQDAEVKLEEYRETWRDQLDELNRDTDEKLRDLKRNWRDQLDELDAETEDKLSEIRDNWMSSILGLQKDTENAFSRMTSNLVNTMGDRSKWSSAGVQAIEGVLVGIASRTPKLIEGVEEAMEQALEAANRTLGIRSPSRKFAEVGRYSMEGLANGLRKYANLAITSTKDLGANMLDSIQSSIARISDAIDGKIESQPTIRPVLDLSDIETNAQRLNTMFSRKQALSINAKLSETEDSDTSGDSPSKNSGVVKQFIQNNYSPKALSRVEIYRQTKNLFSAQERMVET